MVESLHGSPGSQHGVPTFDESEAEPRSLWEVSNTLQDEVDKLLDSTRPTEWDEDYLSISVVQCVRRVLGLAGVVRGPVGVIGLAAEAYKITGTAERTHGDIAIVVRHVFRDGRQVEGTGFYEAKAAGEQSDYPAFQPRQLRRLLTSTPRLTLLLYERQRALVSADPFFAMMDHEDSRGLAVRSVRAQAVGANLVLGHRNPGNAAHFYGEPFAFHLTSRYLSGKDLDYSRSPREALERWLKTTKRSPPVVLGLTVAQRVHVQTGFNLPGYQILPSTDSRFALDLGLE